MILAARPQDSMASFWDSYNEQQQQQQAGQQGNSPGPSMPGHEQGISAPIPSTSSTRHNSVLDSVHSASFLYQSPSDDLQQFQANLNASRSLPQPTHFGHFDPRHTGYDSYLSVSPKTVDSPGLLPPLPMSFPPFNTSMNKPSSGRPVVYEPYPHNFGASFSTGSTINPAASSNPYASQGYQSNMAKLEGTSASAQQQASQTPSSTIGELLNSIPRGEQHLSNALPSIPRPGGSALLTIKPFTRKLFDMLIDPELQDLLYWDEPGRAIVICSGHPKFKSQVLHPAFGHSSVQSFHRQLNVYRFKRVDIHSLLIRTLPRCECSAWAHPDFARDGERFLYKLQPRPSKARRLKKEQQEADRRRKSFEETGRSVTSPSARRRRSSYDDSLSPEDLTLLHQMASPTYSNGSASAEDDAHTMSLVAAGLVAPAQMSARPLA